jgi:hypothetical protein
MSEEVIRTEAEESGQFYDGPPIPVHVTKETYRQEAAEHVSYMQYNLTGGGQLPTQILPRNPQRKRAIVSFLAGVNSPKLTYHYDPGQLQNGNGYPVLTGQNPVLEVKNERALYALCLSGAANATAQIAVMDEYYAAEARESYS